MPRRPRISQLSLTTDYAADTGDPSPCLRAIAEHGFTHVHWCHHWNTDFVYARPEVDQIKRWLDEYGLKVLDLHGSSGREKSWASPVEWARLAGVELVRNRIDMVSRLGGDVVIMHLPADPGSAPLMRSLDELRGYAVARGVCIALENGSFDAIEHVLSVHGPEYVGLCYDSGHGNHIPDGLERLDAVKSRLISVHLHDNDGTEDLHNPLFSGTLDWIALARILSESAYKKPVSMEVTMGLSGIEDEEEFLMTAFRTGRQFTKMIDVAMQGD
jgi:sugar phosphate isomerase/epimerase